MRSILILNQNLLCEQQTKDLRQHTNYRQVTFTTEQNSVIKVLLNHVKSNLTALQKLSDIYLYSLLLLYNFILQYENLWSVFIKTSYG